MEKTTTNTTKLIIIVLAVLSVLLVGTALVHRSTITTLESNLASTTNSMTHTIEELEEDLAKAKTSRDIMQKELAFTYNERADLVQQLTSTKLERDKFEAQLTGKLAEVSAIEQQIQNLVGTVGELDKLRKTDPELLQKYSKIFFLNEHYFPAKIVPIGRQYLSDPLDDEWIHEQVWPHLQELLDDAHGAGVDLKVYSAFRSFDAQTRIKSSHSIVFGEGANKFSADQGYSEHQLGTTIDFTTSNLNSAVRAFEDSSAFAWLKRDAYKYGFILSYPKGNEHYVYEPWHWRFVGKALATKLKNESKHFYDLDQREIDEHLVTIFD